MLTIENKQTNVARLTLKVFQQKHNRQLNIRMYRQKELLTELYKAKISVLISLNEHLVIQM